MDDLLTPLTQSSAFEATCTQLGLQVQRIEGHAGSCLVQTRRLPVIGSFNLVSRGPIAPSEAAARDLLREVRRQVKGVLVVNASAGLSRPGGVKLAGGAALAMLDLEAPETMRARLHQKWRNQLKKAERADLTLTDQSLNTQQHKWFLEAEAEQQKDRRYRSYPAGFLLAYAAANKGQARLYTASQNGTPVAGMLVLKHGRMATYQAGVTTPAGRAACAHNLLLWQIMSDLQRRGFEQLDLGRADLNPGLKRFKMGTGARIETLPGSFLTHAWFTRSMKTSRLRGQIA